MNNTVHCYAGKAGAARQYSLPQPAAVQCMQLLAAHVSRPAKALLVALANGARRGTARRMGCWSPLGCACSCR